MSKETVSKKGRRVKKQKEKDTFFYEEHLYHNLTIPGFRVVEIDFLFVFKNI